jgi:hypothetical protein
MEVLSEEMTAKRFIGSFDSRIKSTTGLEHN